LKTEDEAHLPVNEDAVLVETDAADALQITARKRNAVAMANFAMSFTDSQTRRKIPHGAFCAQTPALKHPQEWSMKVATGS
jgi:hypothetical protein